VASAVSASTLILAKMLPSRDRECGQAPKSYLLRSSMTFAFLLKVRRVDIRVGWPREEGYL